LHHYPVEVRRTSMSTHHYICGCRDEAKCSGTCLQTKVHTSRTPAKLSVVACVLVLCHNSMTALSDNLATY
jgi:hypothetical protein